MTHLWTMLINVIVNGDVVVGCQYYYDSRTITRNDDDDGQSNLDGDLHGEDDMENDEENDEIETVLPVSDKSCMPILLVSFE